MEEVILTTETIKKRSIIKDRLDSFMDFQWRGLEAFKNFGAFIINDKKGSLKFYNGPSFSNEYSKPQFDNNSGGLMGVTFNRQTISFSVGVYWIGVEDYRKLINWLHPLVIDYIIFDFEPRYRYNVKLSKIGDSTRWFIGNERVEKEISKTDENGNVVKDILVTFEPRYYTELNLTFEVQGVQCAKGVNSYEWVYDIDGGDNSTKEFTHISKIKTETNEFIKSDLSTPFDYKFSFTAIGEDNDANQNIGYDMKLEASYKNSLIELFNISFSNITLFKKEDENHFTINISYNSETGLLLLNQGNNDYLLTLVTTADTGEKIVDNLMVNKFLIPGLFEFPNFDYNDFSLILHVKKKKNGQYIEGEQLKKEYFNSAIECYPRTNLI